MSAREACWNDYSVRDRERTLAKRDSLDWVFRFRNMFFDPFLNRCFLNQLLVASPYIGKKKAVMPDLDVDENY